MKKELALKIIMWISIVGIVFSGYLSYTELFKGICVLGECSFVLGLPACVYGLLMYLAIFIISLLSLRVKK